MEKKFRAWDIINSQMMIHRMIGIGLKNINNKSDQFVYMQWTGLKDKNGVEVYEDDIVNTALIHHGKAIKPFWKSKITYNSYVACYQITYRNMDDNFVNDNIGQSYELEIIGNIHENSELINPSK